MEVLVRNATGMAAKNGTADGAAILGTITDAAGALPDVVGSFASTHRDGIEALCIVVGLVVALCGRLILRPVVFLLGFLPTFALFSSIGLSLITDVNPEKLSAYEMVALVSSCVLAILVGWVTLKMLFRVAVFGICSIMGGFMVLILSLYFPPPISDNAQLFRDALAGVIAICTGFLSMYWRETSAIFGTAVDGSAIAVYALGRFLGKRPQLFHFDENTPNYHWWKVFYASFTLALAAFSAAMQLRLFRAENAADRNNTASSNININSNNSNINSGHKRANGYAPIGDLEEGSGNHADNELEPPKSPPYSNEDEEDGFGSGYGATDNNEYLVADNLGAPPLSTSSHILGNSDADQTTPRMTRLKGSPFSQRT